MTQLNQIKKRYLFEGKDVNGKTHQGCLSVITKRENVPEGCYISNRRGMPFAYRVIPETVKMVNEVMYEINNSNATTATGEGRTRSLSNAKKG